MTQLLVLMAYAEKLEQELIQVRNDRDRMLTVISSVAKSKVRMDEKDPTRYHVVVNSGDFDEMELIMDGYPS